MYKLESILISYVLWNTHKTANLLEDLWLPTRTAKCCAVFLTWQAFWSLWHKTENSRKTTKLLLLRTPPLGSIWPESSDLLWPVWIILHLKYFSFVRVYLDFPFQIFCVIYCTNSFFYKNILYKNIETEVCEILRIF